MRVVGSNCGTRRAIVRVRAHRSRRSLFDLERETGGHSVPMNEYRDGGGDDDGGGDGGGGDCDCR